MRMLMRPISAGLRASARHDWRRIGGAVALQSRRPPDPGALMAARRLAAGDFG